MGKFKEITRDELKKWMDEKKDFVLIDVLSEASYNAKHLPGAKHADPTQPDFLEKVKQLTGGDKNKTIVVYCASFTCQLSPFAAKKLTDAGYTNVYDFKGGIADWQDGGYQFEEGNA